MSYKNLSGSLLIVEILPLRLTLSNLLRYKIGILGFSYLIGAAQCDILNGGSMLCTNTLVFIRFLNVNYQ
jgi:hypothetical protein